MKVCVAGNGKLAKSILEGLDEMYNPVGWDEFDPESGRADVVIHAGSGRQLAECLNYCNSTGAVLMELSTGGDIAASNVKCPVLLCSNTAVPVLKMMNILKLNGVQFSDCNISILESHQKNKTTVAGTAIDIAQALDVAGDKVQSVRDVDEQLRLGIPEQHLALHAYHKIVIESAGCEVAIELKVLGHDAYVHGVAYLLDMLPKYALPVGIHDVVDIIGAM